MTANPRETVGRARAALDAAEQQLTPRARAWRQLFGRPSLRMLVGGGLASGFVLTAVPPRWWSRAGAAVFGAGAALARSPIGPVLFATLWTSIAASKQVQPAPDSRTTSTQP
jgi:hypothetical protein